MVRTLFIQCFTVYDAGANTKKTTRGGELAENEQAHTYESINDPTIGENSHYNNMNIELHDAMSAVSYPQSITTAKLDKSNRKKQEKPHLQLNTITSCTTSSSTVQRQHDHHLVPSRSNADSSQCLHADSQYGKTPCSYVDQLEAVSEDLEWNTCSCDQQVDQRRHYDKICQYERISHYEKVPHCDLSLISSQRKPCNL